MISIINSQQEVSLVPSGACRGLRRGPSPLGGLSPDGGGGLSPEGGGGLSPSESVIVCICWVKYAWLESYKITLIYPTHCFCFKQTPDPLSGKHSNPTATKCLRQIYIKVLFLVRYPFSQISEKNLCHN